MRVAVPSLSTLCALALFSAGAAGAQASNGAGCFLSTYSGTPISEFRTQRSTGFSALDATVEHEAELMREVFGVWPGLTYFVEPPGMGGNALATSDRLFLPKQDGTVLLGLGLLQAEIDSGPSGRWHSAVIGIMAHEWAHIYQTKHRDLSRMSVLWRELHADFLAGWYLGVRYNEGLRIGLEGFSKSIWNKGDFAFTDPDHHGVPAERMMIMTEGYAFAVDEKERSVKAASQEAADHLVMDGDRVTIRLHRSVRPCAPNCR